MQYDRLSQQQLRFFIFIIYLADLEEWSCHLASVDDIFVCTSGKTSLPGID